LPAREFLERIRRLFDGPSEHLDLVAEAIVDGRLKQPVKPMTDHELAQAIREFRNAPASQHAIERLGSNLAKDED
jgi:hypothetical protein